MKHKMTLKNTRMMKNSAWLSNFEISILSEKSWPRSSTIHLRWRYRVASSLTLTASLLKIMRWPKLSIVSGRVRLLLYYTTVKIRAYEVRPQRSIHLLARPLIGQSMPISWAKQLYSDHSVRFFHQMPKVWPLWYAAKPTTGRRNFKRLILAFISAMARATLSATILAFFEHTFSFKQFFI